MVGVFDKRAAQEAVAALRLERGNDALAAFWLARWRGGALPPRAAIQPARLKAFLPNIALFNVVPDVRVELRLAGTRCMHILGLDAASCEDWIAVADAADQPARLARFSAVARGAVGIEHWRLPSASAEDLCCETILLPFAPDADGTVAVLAHMPLRLDRYLDIVPLSPAAEPRDIRLLTLEPGAEDGREAVA